MKPVYFRSLRDLFVHPFFDTKDRKRKKRPEYSQKNKKDEENNCKSSGAGEYIFHGWRCLVRYAADRPNLPTEPLTRNERAD